MTTNWTMTVDCADPAAPGSQVAGGRDKPQQEREARIREKVEQLVAAGATVVREVADNGVLDHFWMADPEGNDFCVV
jgi:predicted enzyme related to lactoylglutathione lyase